MSGTVPNTAGAKSHKQLLMWMRIPSVPGTMLLTELERDAVEDRAEEFGNCAKK